MQDDKGMKWLAGLSDSLLFCTVVEAIVILSIRFSKLNINLNEAQFLVNFWKLYCLIAVTVILYLICCHYKEGCSYGKWR